MTTAIETQARAPERSPELLPERLERFAGSLIMYDALLTLAVIVAALALHAERAGLLTATILVFAGYASGRYLRSFAVVPRDEIYGVLAFAIPAFIFALVFAALLGINVVAVTIVAAVWTAASAWLSMRSCARRRGSSGVRAGISYSVDHRGRARARWPLSTIGIEACDMLLSLVGIVLLSPVLAVCAIAVARGDGMPVLFRQRRIGQNDRDFVMYKFRTMRTDAGNEWATSSDERITRAGRLLRRSSLDELPQLFNVLKREMSLVGPRPEMAEYAHRFSHEMLDYADRHLVRPGITGWAQVNFDRNPSPDDARRVLRYDLFYVQNRSFYLYCYCLVKTLCEAPFHPAV